MSVPIVDSPLAKDRAGGDFASHQNKSNFFPDLLFFSLPGYGQRQKRTGPPTNLKKVNAREK